ncbi:hypothetical protein G6L37_03005 [Agrobacterium rubi]|nr:hypothetical protein [Agrobacterium rubi]NTF24347.1 hypothetical protein [Agrobacterium rubi]
MRLSSSKNSGVPGNLIAQVRAGGEPVTLRVDQIVSADTVRGSLLVGSLGFKANQSITIKAGQGVTASKSLMTAIAGNDRAAMLVPNDVIAFENAYEYEGTIYADAVSARTNDMQRGKVQVVTAMVRPSKSLVNKKGALQSIVIADGKNAKTAKTTDKVREFFAWIASQQSPGGTPGILVRDRGGRVTKEFFAEGRSTVDALIEDLEHEDTFAEEGSIIEMIPVWRLPMGRSQVLRDIGDPKTEVSAQIGPFTRQFVSPDTRGFPGFLPCLVVLCEEDQWEFGAKTGRKAVVAAGVQPIDKLPPIAREKLPTAVRNYKGVPNGINRLYSDETMVAMAKERLIRSPDAPIAVSGSSINQPSSRPASRFARAYAAQSTEKAPPPPETGPRRFGR